MSRNVVRVVTRATDGIDISAAKGLEEKDYAFSLNFFDEVVPEVRLRWRCACPYR